MALSRKDFKAIVQELRTTKPIEPTFRRQWRRDCLAVAEALKTTNPRFNETKFLGACEETKA